MKRYFNRFFIRHKQSGNVLTVNNNSKYLDSHDSAKQWRNSFCDVFGYTKEEFDIVPVDGSPIEVDNFTAEENQILEQAKVFSGKGLRLKTLEKPNDHKYKPWKFQPHEVRMAESVQAFKGQPVIFKQTGKKRKETISSDIETFNKLLKQPKHGTLSRPHDGLKSRILQLLSQGMNKCQILRELRPIYKNVSRNELQRVIGSI